jgi:hypothetical protein
MEKAELLATFTEHVETYARYRGFIDKARSRQDDFSTAVIEKVCLDNEVKSQGVSAEVVPLIADVDKVIEGLQFARDDIETTKASADERMEELKLRQLIGELEGDAFDAEAAALQSELDSSGQRIEEIESEIQSFQAVLESWLELSESAGHASGRTDGEEESSFDEASEDLLREDLSDVYGDEDAAAPEIEEPLEEVAIEVGEVSDDVGVDVDFALDDAGGEDLDILAEAGEMDIDLLGGDDAEEIGVELTGAEGEIPPADEDGPRRALLLYQEGTPEEQIYPFTSDIITIGRGRENDIQIKNDSKVSRYHCKIFLRGDNFYIEDNKSSNGSLVNGELVTERRLFGGEEIVIGETFFRFRIMA